MTAYMLRWYALRAQLWERGREDYNHLWAEPFLNTTLTLHGVNIIRDPLVRVVSAAEPCASESKAARARMLDIRPTRSTTLSPPARLCRCSTTPPSQKCLPCGPTGGMMRRVEA